MQSLVLTHHSENGHGSCDAEKDDDSLNTTTGERWSLRTKFFADICAFSFYFCKYEAENHHRTEKDDDSLNTATGERRWTLQRMGGGAARDLWPPNCYSLHKPCTHCTHCTIAQTLPTVTHCTNLALTACTVFSAQHV